MQVKFHTRAEKKKRPRSLHMPYRLGLILGASAIQPRSLPTQTASKSGCFLRKGEGSTSTCPHSNSGRDPNRHNCPAHSQGGHGLGTADGISLPGMGILKKSILAIRLDRKSHQNLISSPQLDNRYQNNSPVPRTIVAYALSRHVLPRGLDCDLILCLPGSPPRELEQPP